MRTAKFLAVALVASTASFSFSQSATSGPLMNNAALSSAASASSDIENVQYRGRYRGGYRHHHHGGGGGAGLGLGLAAGAIIGGGIAASAAQANQNHAYCAQRYRSYDPASGTYLNNDGNRYPCP